MTDLANQAKIPLFKVTLGHRYLISCFHRRLKMLKVSQQASDLLLLLLGAILSIFPAPPPYSWVIFNSKGPVRVGAMGALAPIAFESVGASNHGFWQFLSLCHEFS